jgi:hypothetical protein
MLLIKSMFKFTLIMGLCICAQVADAQETVLPRNGELNDVASLVLADTVRKKSASGELTYPEELSTALAKSGISTSITDWSCVHQKFSDFREAFTTGGKKCFYSSRTMREPYVRILLRRDTPIPLIADVVRESSLIYPRPLPLALFTQHPFALSADKVLKEIDEMRRQGQFTDICQTVTSIATIFLYSAQYLDSTYAAMLAEWYDVGQSNNP